MTTDQPTTATETETEETRGCHRVGCTFEVVTAHAHGPIAIVCTGTCGRSWPVTPAENVAGYLVVSTRGTDTRLWNAPRICRTPAEAKTELAFWQKSHAAMNRDITLRTAAVVFLPDQTGQ
ncbi:hypothetical protein [Streptosporangium sp. NPDC051022]|uniref:hypothetical protein n=1 Tax=Streptosporangium sp. NPDC051022 TaxID=3155752 RepID=UPI00341B5138